MLDSQKVLTLNNLTNFLAEWHILTLSSLLCDLSCILIWHKKRGKSMSSATCYCQSRVRGDLKLNFNALVIEHVWLGSHCCDAFWMCIYVTGRRVVESAVVFRGLNWTSVPVLVQTLITRKMALFVLLHHLMPQSLINRKRTIKMGSFRVTKCTCHLPSCHKANST